jgi:hypothetical protein
MIDALPISQRFCAIWSGLVSDLPLIASILIGIVAVVLIAIDQLASPH